MVYDEIRQSESKGVKTCNVGYQRFKLSFRLQRLLKIQKESRYLDGITSLSKLRGV